MERCDADLLLELAKWKFDRENITAAGDPQEVIDELNSRRVDVFVTYTGDVRALQDSPLAIGHYDGIVATGTIPLAEIENLQRLDGVTHISLAAKVHLPIDRSIPEIKANLLRTNAPPYTASVGPQAYTGKGVLIGIIDDSIYERHQSFIKPNPDPKTQKTRIIGIWDQITPPDTSKGQISPPGFNYGTFWDETAINRVLAAGMSGFGAIRLASTVDHGSHVTGIAAGNGFIKDNQFARYTFVGVAPEADIIFCNAAAYEASGASVADAMKFIFGLAEERSQPCVINMSFGTHEGARDGSSDLERAIDRALLDSNGDPVPGRAVVVSAGNDADMRRHSRKLISAGGKLVFRLQVGEVTFPNGLRTKPRPENDKLLSYDKMYIWYSGTASIQIRVTPPGAAPDPAGFVKAGEIKVSTSIGIVVSGEPDPANGKNYMTITLFAPVKNGEWKIEMQETAGVETPVDIWVDRLGDSYIYPRFIDGDDVVANTVTCPSTAKTAIAVGAYISEPAIDYGEHYGDICRFSSRGLDSVFGVNDEDTRPHLVAPGRRIIGPNNSSFADEGNRLNLISLRFDGWTLSMHALMSGTSQAAPHVTGTVALMFQRNPNLTAKEILDILKATTSTNKIPSLVFPNRTWGYGKLDASAAVAQVPLP
jgi:subtilisin family serine protease